MPITKATASSIAPAAKGDLVVGSATNDAAVLAVGANGTTLVADSAEATGLKWAAPSAGGMTSLASGNLSGSNTTTISSISGAYKNLMLFVKQWRPTTDNQYLSIRFNGNSSAIYGYSFITSQTGAGVLVNSFTDTEIEIVDANNGQSSSTDRNFLDMTIFDYTNTTTLKVMNFSTQFQSAAGVKRLVGGFGCFGDTDTPAITSITLFINGGSNFQSGSYELFGVK